MENQALDAFTVLDVNFGSSRSTIRENYKKLSIIFHPDKSSSLPEPERKKNEQMFKQITRAYNILMDDDLRMEYISTLSGGGTIEQAYMAASRFEGDRIDATRKRSKRSADSENKESSSSPKRSKNSEGWFSDDDIFMAAPMSPPKPKTTTRGRGRGRPRARSSNTRTSNSRGKENSNKKDSTSCDLDIKQKLLNFFLKKRESRLEVREAAVSLKEIELINEKKKWIEEKTQLENQIIYLQNQLTSAHHMIADISVNLGVNLNPEEV